MFYFLVWFNNFAQTTGFYWSYTLLLKLPILLCALDYSPPEIKSSLLVPRVHVRIPLC